MLKKVKNSQPTGKLGGTAATYRRGGQTFSTCPSTCPLNPNPEHSTDEIDRGYLARIRRAVPRNGVAWLYTHFSWRRLRPAKPGEVVVNFSADNIADAVEATEAGFPAVVTLPLEAPTGVIKFNDTRIIPCPENVNNKTTCKKCGGGVPLCARNDRDYVISFRAHGTSKKKVGDPNAQGGCYAAAGRVRMQWEKCEDNDESLLDWVESLPEGTLLRHHVAGDIGKT